MTGRIPFNKPHFTGRERRYIEELHAAGHLAGDGSFTKRCQLLLEQHTGCKKALLTHSCTAALEMSALLLNIQPGDEVILPSYTFVSTANAFVLRGAVPVFVDIREDTLNINEHLIEDAITSRTRAIVPVHYAGVSCNMDEIIRIATRNGLDVVEDAAQGLMSTYKERPLGSMGDLGAFSFHETKNVISGEGGSLMVNRPDLVSRAEIIREKGTDRSRFIRGEVDKYTWQEVGSSFLPAELIAAFLLAQLEDMASITQARLKNWQYYHDLLTPLATAGVLRVPFIPPDCQHNAHMYYVILPETSDRKILLDRMKERSIHATTHYVPLHSSPAGQRLGRVSGSLHVTESIAERLIRLPLWVGMTAEEQELVVEILKASITG